MMAVDGCLVGGVRRCVAACGDVWSRRKSDEVVGVIDLHAYGSQTQTERDTDEPQLQRERSKQPDFRLI
jgi:hypothetical protein